MIAFGLVARLMVTVPPSTGVASLPSMALLYATALFVAIVVNALVADVESPMIKPPAANTDPDTLALPL